MRWAVLDLEDLISHHAGLLSFALDQLAEIGAEKARIEQTVVEEKARLRDYRAALAVIDPQAEAARPGTGESEPATPG